MDDADKAAFTAELITSFDIEAKIVNRKKYNVVYLKDGEHIVDVLNIMGAHVSIVYKDAPVIEIPVAYNAEEDNVLRADDLNVKIFFGSYGYFRSETTFANSFQVAEWKLTVLHSGAVVSEKVYLREGRLHLPRYGQRIHPPVDGIAG